jgi:hypothetical protein
MTLLLRGCASDAVAIMARAESSTVAGACPWAELIEPSAGRRWPRCATISNNLIVGPQKQKPRQAGPRVMLGVEAVLGQTGLIRCARTGGRFP